MNWLELQRQVEELAANFQHQGIEPGSGVALCGKNSYPLLLAYLALLQCGARLLPLNPALPTAQLATLLPELDIAFFFSLDALPALPASMISLALPSSKRRWFNPVPWVPQHLATLNLRFQRCTQSLRTQLRGSSGQRLRGTAIVEVPAARSLAIVIAAVSRFRSGHCLALVGGGCHAGVAR